MDLLELDSLVARHVYGLVVIIDTQKGANYIMGKNGTPMELPLYSTDMEAVDDIEKRLERQGWYLSVRNTVDAEKSKWIACFLRDDEKSYLPSKADTLPAAVCMAAVAALTGKNVQQ